MPKTRKAKNSGLVPAVDGSRNRKLCRGINALSKSAMNKAAGRYKFRGKGGPKKVAEPKAAGPDPTSKWYPADDVPGRLTRRFTPGTAKLRASITPGTVLIVLSGRFRSKRVVFLKQLESGLLLVTGPFKLNGVPLRRMNQAYVIATSTKVDLPAGFSVPDSVNDEFFKRPSTNATSAEDRFWNGDDVPAVEIDADRKALQKSVDTQLISAIPKDMQLYLKARFSLSNGQYPHNLAF
eukprot:367939_1